MSEPPAREDGDVGPAGAERPAPPAAPLDDGWRRLDGRVFALHLVRLVGALAPVAAVLVFGGQITRGLVVTLVTVFGARAVAVAGDALRWRTTRYRVTAERVELHSGLLRRSDRSVPRDRIRTVDLTAKPLHRVFGLMTVRVGTGRGGGNATRGTGGDLALDAIAAPEADRLRRELLARGAAPAAVAASHGAAVATADAGEPRAPAADRGGERPEAAADGRGELLARLRWRWLPYDLLSPWTLALPVVAFGAALQALDAVGVESVAFDAARDGADRVVDLPIVLAVLTVVALLLVLGLLAAAALFVATWWGFELRREPDGTLRLRRGLLTSRSISIEQRRLRGVELVEPLLLRAVGGAHLRAIAAGLRSGEEGTKGARTNALLPSAPRAEAERLGAEVLGEDPQERARPLAALAPHPPAARRRRLGWALETSAVAGAALAVAGPGLGWLPGWAPLLALGLLPVALLLALDAAAALGHGLRGSHLVTRSGTPVRRTFVLERDGVIGWTVSRTVFQRRAGLATLTATMAAGRGGYEVLDVDESDGLAFAEAATPGILAPFLERAPTADHAPERAARASATTPPSAA